MKHLITLALLLWFLGWLYLWVVVWAGVDIWGWVKKAGKRRRPR